MPNEKTAAVASDVAMASADAARRELSALDDLREDLDIRERTFLRSRGWRFTSQTPGFVWMWAKMIQGVQIIAVQVGAVAYERSILLGHVPRQIGHKDIRRADAD